MKQIIIISLFSIFYSAPVVLAQEYDDGPKFIYHDSIPLTLVDSVYNFSGNKIAATSYAHALTPAYPIRKKMIFSSEARLLWQAGKLNCFKLSEGISQACINYVTLINGDTILIDSHKKFREIFAPIDNVQEAIAFAYFFTDSEPIYNLDFLKREPRIKYILDFERGVIIDSVRLKEYNHWDINLPVISSSYAKKADDGYELLLYHYQLFGCSHPYSERLIKVYTDGRVEIIKEQKAFNENEFYHLCVD